MIGGARRGTTPPGRPEGEISFRDACDLKRAGTPALPWTHLRGILRRRGREALPLALSFTIGHLRCAQRPIRRTRAFAAARDLLALMSLANLLIVADRGNVKAYSVQKSPTHGLTASLADQVQFNEPHQRAADQLTDQAGAFPNAGTNGQGNSLAERGTLEIENDSRLFHRIGRTISEMVAKHEAVSWSLAAPAEINAQILKNVSPKLQGTLQRNLKHDYVKTPVRDIPKRFGLEG